MDERDEVLNEEGQARRRFLKQAATVAWATPWILTMMSRAAHAQPVQCGTIDAGGTCDVTTACGSPTVCTPIGDPGDPCLCLTGL